MKKFLVMGCVAFAAILMTSCKSTESGYKAAYERAQQKQQSSAAEVTPVVPGTQDQAQQNPVVTPVTPIVTPTDPNTVSVRQEAVTVINGAGLKAYSVVLGSFGVQANAEKLQAELQAAGYSAQIVLKEGSVPAMYRVIATTHDDKEGAVRSRDVFKANPKFKDAWLLYQK